jgi:hypothetical protein
MTHLTSWSNVTFSQIGQKMATSNIKKGNYIIKWDIQLFKPLSKGEKTFEFLNFWAFNNDWIIKWQVSYFYMLATSRL